MKKIICLLVVLLCLLWSGCNADTTQKDIATKGTESSETVKNTEASDKKEPEAGGESGGSAESEGEKEPQKEPEGGVEPPVEPEIEPEFYEPEYVIGSISGAKGENMVNAERFRTEEYMLISDIEAIALLNGYSLTWFAYDEDLVYLGNGSNAYPTMPSGGVWLPEGKDLRVSEVLEWNENSVYLRFAVRRQDGKDVTMEDVALSDVKIYVSGYPGENIYDSVSCEKIASIADSRQDGAVWGDYLFSFNSAGVCNVYSLDGYTYLSDFTLDKNSLINPHSNSVCFGSYKYSESDEFPLLYCNVYNTYKNDRNYDGTCNVYRLQRQGNTFSTQLVQVIKIGFTNDTQRWASSGGDVRPFGNFAVDTDTDTLYAFTMRDEGRTTRFFAFDLPLPTDGALDSSLGVLKVTLGVEDIKDSFDTDYSYYVQGAQYYDGKIYSLEGFTNNSTNRPAVKVIDLESKKICARIDLYGMGFKTEPEVMYVLDGELYYIDISGNVCKFNFES